MGIYATDGSMNITLTDAPTFTTIEVGTGTDTTISRVSAGKIAVEGVNVVTVSSTDTLTNKTLTNPVVMGTTAADNAVSGQVGETLGTSVESGSGISLTTATSVNVTSVSLTAGDWVVSGVVYFLGAAATSFTLLQMGIGSTTGTIGSSAGTFNLFQIAALVPGATHPLTLVLPVQRFNVSSTTPIYLVANATFTISTAVAYGRIEAHRVR